jgi:hypothetical protein
MEIAHDIDYLIRGATQLAYFEMAIIIQSTENSPYGASSQIKG